MTSTPTPGAGHAAARPTPGTGHDTAGLPAPTGSSTVARVDAADRGTTTLADRVVEKIAARAALDVTHALGLSRRVAGREFGTPTVRAHAQVDGHVASLGLELAVEYPAPVRTTTRDVRSHVGERVAALCDLTVDHIDITVAVLRRPREEGRRVQ